MGRFDHQTQLYSVILGNAKHSRLFLKALPSYSFHSSSIKNDSLGVLVNEESKHPNLIDRNHSSSLQSSMKIESSNIGFVGLRHVLSVNRSQGYRLENVKLVENPHRRFH